MIQRLLTDVRLAARRVKIIIEIIDVIVTVVDRIGADLAALIADDDIDHNGDQDQQQDQDMDVLANQG